MIGAIVPPKINEGTKELATFITSILGKNEERATFRQISTPKEGCVPRSVSIAHAINCVVGCLLFTGLYPLDVSIAVVTCRFEQIST